MKSWFRVDYCWQKLLAGNGGCSLNRLHSEAFEAQPLRPRLGAGLEIAADPKRDPNVIIT